MIRKRKYCLKKKKNLGAKFAFLNKTNIQLFFFFYFSIETIHFLTKEFNVITQFKAFSNLI